MFLDTFRIYVDNCEKTNQGVDFSNHCTLKGSLLGGIEDTGEVIPTHLPSLENKWRIRERISLVLAP